MRIGIISWCIFEHLRKHQAAQQLRLNEFCVSWDGKEGPLGGRAAGGLHFRNKRLSHFILFTQSTNAALLFFYEAAYLQVEP